MTHLKRAGDRPKGLICLASLLPRTGRRARRMETRGAATRFPWCGHHVGNGHRHTWTRTEAAFTSAIRHRMSRGFDETESFRDSFLPLYVETPPLPDTEPPVTYCQIDLPTQFRRILSDHSRGEDDTLGTLRFLETKFIQNSNVTISTRVKYSKLFFNY